MASKVLLVFAVLLAAAFLVASANEQTQANKEEESTDGFPYGGYPGRGGGYYPGRGGGYPGRGGGYPGRSGGYPGRGGGRGGHCRYGCCSRGFYGGCRCCSGADEIPEPMYRPEVVEVHN